MRKASIWEVVVAELARLEAQGKDDHRDSWMGNAIKAVNRLEEHCRKHNAYPEFVTAENYRSFGLIKAACPTCLMEFYMLEPRHPSHTPQSERE